MASNLKNVRIISDLLNADSADALYSYLASPDICLPEPNPYPNLTLNANRNQWGTYPR